MSPPAERRNSAPDRRRESLSTGLARLEEHVANLGAKLDEAIGEIRDSRRESDADMDAVRLRLDEIDRWRTQHDTREQTLQAERERMYRHAIGRREFWLGICGLLVVLGAAILSAHGLFIT